jgi:hypothetical protein
MSDSFAETETGYNVFDPDQPPVSLSKHALERTPESVYKLLTGLDCILDLAGFRPVPSVYIEVAQKSEGIRGLRVQPPPLGALGIQLFYRRILPITVC